MPLFVTAVTEELGSEVQSGILGFEHNKKFLICTQHTETSSGVEIRLCLLQYSPGDVVGDSPGNQLPAVPTQPRT